MKLHDSHLSRLAAPELRGYVIAVAASLAIIFTAQFEDGSVAAAGVPVLCGVAGLLLRWTAMPIAVVLTLGYFLIFPIGSPVGSVVRVTLRGTHLRFDDLILVAAVLVYLASQFRLFDLTDPNEKSAAQTSRPPALVVPSELPRLFVAVAMLTLLGQGLWWLLASVEPHFGPEGPLRWVPFAFMRLGRSPLPSTQSPELGRLLLLVLLIAAVAGLARFMLWYLRLNRLGSEEARLMLIDTTWSENRRELARIETWRSYKLGHNRNRAGKPDETFRWIVRTAFLLVFGAFLVWILYFYFNIP